MERFNLKKLNEVEVEDQYRVEVSNRFAALEDLDAEVESNSAWETIRENTKISTKESLGYFEFKKRLPWSNEGCLKLADQSKETTYLRCYLGDQYYIPFPVCSLRMSLTAQLILTVRIDE
jgi:hypothetical protein